MPRSPQSRGVLLLKCPPDPSDDAECCLVRGQRRTARRVSAAPDPAPTPAHSPNPIRATEAYARVMAFLGVVDESTPAYEADTVVYAVALALFDDRDSLCRLPIEAHVSARIAGSSEQQAARDTILIDDLLPYAIGRSVGGFQIEQRSKREDDRDRQTIRTWYRDGQHNFTSIDHVDKTEPLAWISDALAGIWTSIVLGRDGGWSEQLVAAGTLRSSRIDEYGTRKCVDLTPFPDVSTKIEM